MTMKRLRVTMSLSLFNIIKFLVAASDLKILSFCFKDQADTGKRG